MTTTESIVRACSACSARNRIPVKHLSHSGKCGSCKADLPPLAEPLEADTATFDAVVNSVDVPVLVDFWAEWCGPCRMAAPHVKKLAEQMAGKAVVLKVDTDQHPELAARYHVRGIPNFVVFKNGRVVSQQAGLVPAQQMRRWLESAQAAA
jgi:thioredoxin 2